MPSIDRPLSGDGLHFRLGGSEVEKLIDQDALAKAGRSARTLVKDGPLRVTLVALAPGSSIAEHRAAGPITAHVVSGVVSFRTDAQEWTLEAGDLLSLGGGVAHEVRSSSGGAFLLTVSAPPKT